MRRAGGSQVGWGARLLGPQSAGGQWVATADEAWMTATGRRRNSLRALRMLDGHGQWASAAASSGAAARANAE